MLGRSVIEIDLWDEIIMELAALIGRAGHGEKEIVSCVHAKAKPCRGRVGLADVAQYRIIET